MEALGRKGGGGKGVNMSAEEDCLVEVWGGWTMVQRCNEVGKVLSVERCKTMDGFLP